MAPMVVGEAAVRGEPGQGRSTGHLLRMTVKPRRPAVSPVYAVDCSRLGGTRQGD